MVLEKGISIVSWCECSLAVILFMNMHLSHFLISSALCLFYWLCSNNDLDKTLDEMVAKFKEWYPDMLS